MKQLFWLRMISLIMMTINEPTNFNEIILNLDHENKYTFLDLKKSKKIARHC